MSHTESAILGGGCFWCLEAVYEQVQGVESVVSGYAGGQDPRPTYEAVCGGRTGHAEVVQLTFDPETTSYRELLEIFFGIHDPTTLNRQGGDKGTQYRSVIFYETEEQRATAEAVMRELGEQGIWDGPIVTQLLPNPGFHEAEASHQHYFARNPNQGYCQAVVAPKVSKLRQKFTAKLKHATV